MHASAVLIEGAKKLSLAEIGLKDPEAGDVVVRVQHSGISTGTEKLLWSGAMPPFPGLAYPLVPGYEAVGEVVDATAGTGHKVGDFVFVPGSSGFREAKGLFGGSASYLVTSADRVRKINPALGDSGTLFALAATARHALAGFCDHHSDRHGAVCAGLNRTGAASRHIAGGGYADSLISFALASLPLPFNGVSPESVDDQIAESGKQNAKHLRSDHQRYPNVFKALGKPGPRGLKFHVDGVSADDPGPQLISPIKNRRHG